MRRLSLEIVSIALLLFTGLCLVPMPMPAQLQPAVTPSGSPQTMRLCVGAVCETLSWNGAGYDGVRDNNPQITSHYTVVQWSKQGVRLQAKSAAPVSVDNQRLPGGFPLRRETYAEAFYVGSISADGNSIDGGKMSLQVGKQKSEYQYTLTWDAEPTGPLATGSSACQQGLNTASAPTALLSCEGYCILTNNHGVATWIFNGTSGYGNWPDKEKANLNVQNWSGGQCGHQERRHGRLQHCRRFRCLPRNNLRANDQGDRVRELAWAC